MLWGNTAFCVKLSDEDLSRYSYKIESVSLTKVRIITHEGAWYTESGPSVAPQKAIKNFEKPQTVAGNCEVMMSVVVGVQFHGSGSLVAGVWRC